MTARVAWGILGTSQIGSNRVIPAMLQSERCALVAIASRDEKRAQAVATAAGIPRSYGSYEALLADPAIEAVYVPLPNHLHVEWSLKALAAGKHVLCEKPIAMNAAEAQRLVEGRQRSGRLVEEAFVFRNHPQWQGVRAILRSGEIGTIRSAHCTMAYSNADPNDVRNKPELGGGALYDLGCYAIGAMRYLFEAEPLRVVATSAVDHSLGVDQLTSALLEFRNGHATFSVCTQGGPSIGGTRQHVGVVGSKGWLVMEFPFAHPAPTKCRILIGDDHSIGSTPAREATFDPVNQYTLQADRFSRLVRGEAVQSWPIEDAVANMRVIDGLRRSLVSNKWEQP